MQETGDEPPQEPRAPEEGSWSTYLGEVAQVSRLTAEQEQDLGRRIASGDRQALEHLVKANLRLVIAVAKRYRHEGVELQDLVQEGNIGLLRAAAKFDYRLGYRFSTYAIWWIRQAASRAVANQRSAIRVPVHIQEGHGPKVRRQDCPPEPEVTQADASAETLDLVKRARQTVSLERVLGDDAVLAGAVADETAPSPFEVTCNSLLRQRLLAMLAGLSERERIIVLLWYGLSDGRALSCTEVSQQVHLTRERVRQLEVSALGKLRGAPGSTELRRFVA
jgi:RNA polymerase primary sigma factor